MDVIQELFRHSYYVFTSNGRSVKIIMGVLFLSLFGFFWFLFKYLYKHNILQKLYAKIVSDYRQQNALRQIDMENRIREEGESSLPILYKIDILLQQSGLTRKIPELSAGLFLIVTFSISLLGFVVSASVFDNIALGLVVGGTIFVLTFIYVYSRKDKNMMHIEEDLDLFLNLMENYSYGTDSLYNMLLKASSEVNEPLATYLEECCTEISLNGNITSSLAKLKKKVSHPQFKKMISHLELASMHEANYARIIELNSKTLTIFLDDQKKRRAIKNNSLRELLIIGFCGVLLIGFSLKSELITNVFDTVPGQILTVYSFSVLLIGALSMLKK